MIVNLLWLLGALVFLVAIDENFAAWAYLQVLRLGLFLRTIPLRLRLEWDIYWMKRNMGKYLKMAEEIRKEIEDNETN